MCICEREEKKSDPSDTLKRDLIIRFLELFAALKCHILEGSAIIMMRASDIANRNKRSSPV